MTTVQRTFRRSLAAAAALALSAVVAAVPATPARGDATDTFTVGSLGQVVTFNPFLAFKQGELDPISQLYPTLVWGNAQRLPEHYLADKWTTSADRRTWTFSLHPGLKWSDGKPITADDAAWTLNLVHTNATAGTANGQLLDNVASVKASGDSTVVITTKDPQVNLLDSVGQVPIVPRHVWESRVKTLGDQTNTKTPLVGYGPFTLKSYKTEQSTVLTANKDFFLGAPKYDTLVLQYFKNNDAAVSALRSGEIDQVDRITPTEYKALKSVDGVTSYPQVGARWTGIEINPGARTKSGKKMGTGHPALADAKVRKAIALGIDKQTLVKKVLDGLGQVGQGYLPPAFPAFSWKPPQVTPYDPAAANALLDSAGYTKGSDGVRKDPKSGRALTFRLGTHSDTTTDAQIAAYVVGWLKKIGIGVTIEPLSSTNLNDRLAKGDFDMFMDGWGTGPDPTYLLGIQTCRTLPDNAEGENGNTDAFFCDKRYDALYAQQLRTFDTTQRSAVVGQMQQILYDANVDLILFYQNNLSAVRTNAKNGFVTGKADGQGFYPYQNYTRSWRYAQPPSSSSDGGSSGSAIIWILVAVVVVVGIGAVVVLRRRAGAADRE
ncbi:peptide/nickel transport system substrate-binding protein [Jatrophihabitans endophyticus]|uniref:Peptide/nickel transport system substrate-binding protein n=1 Tax=Jatrophihabitans endophyticus TaxID=1206085 RepID=A0A1M5P4Q0_9ACTN|nr:ABC transporter substrate-binding protein [Jatrophihabitans endophyticus]SHG96786.1 peptide/nickel transport system substrate-binding protein [Jatrophihabitans endophyticus]